MRKKSRAARPFAAKVVALLMAFGLSVATLCTFSCTRPPEKKTGKPAPSGEASLPEKGAEKAGEALQPLSPSPQAPTPPAVTPAPPPAPSAVPPVPPLANPAEAANPQSQLKMPRTGIPLPREALETAIVEEIEPETGPFAIVAPETAMPETKTAAQGQTPPVNKANLPPPPIAQARAFGLAMTTGPIFPEDFSLGPLQNRRPSRLDEKAAAETAAAFLASILAGKEIAVERILPDRRDLLPAILSPFLEGERPVSFRLGKFDFGSEGSDAALAAVALFGPSPENTTALGPRLNGEIALRWEESTWFVESLTVDEPVALGSSGEKGKPDALVFEPRLRQP